MKKFASTSFLWSELECKCGCGNRFIQREAIHKLQLMRNLLGKPIIINSAARCPIHNTTVGGAPKSQHRATESRPSTAFDISLRGIWMKLNSKREKRFFLILSLLRHPCAKTMLSFDWDQGCRYIFRRILDEIEY